jgi:hypothetical protein
MKKNSKVKQSPKRARARKEKPKVIGMDLGDKTSRYRVLDEQGEVVKEGSVATARSHAGEVCADAAVPDGHRSGNAFAVGEPDAKRIGL